MYCSRIPQNSQKQTNAFTLIEVILMTALFLVLAGMSSVFYGQFLLDNAVAETENRIVSFVRTAQGYAMAGKGGLPWGISQSNGKLFLFQGNSFATRNTSLDRTTAIPSNVTINNFSEITFQPVSGTPSVTNTITLSATNGTTQTLTMNTAGVINRQ